MAQGPKVLNARLEAFLQFEATLIGQFHDHVMSAILPHLIPVIDIEPKIHRLVLSIQTFRRGSGRKFL